MGYDKELMEAMGMADFARELMQQTEALEAMAMKEAKQKRGRGRPRKNPANRGPLF